MLDKNKQVTCNMKNMHPPRNRTVIKAECKPLDLSAWCLSRQIAQEKSVVLNEEQVATVSFTNPYSHPVSGVLTVAGAGLIQGKVQFR